ncbi:MAG: succinate dehydrogenase cytochrome b subunit [Ignavibacteria bacterium]
MGWVTRAVRSSLGKKYFMALSGLFLLFYLAVHLFGNTFLYAGRDVFNLYVSTLTETLEPVVRIIELVLLAGFLIHIYDGVTLTIQNWRSRPNRYAVKPEDPQSTLASRNMWLTAAFVGFFLVAHLKQFWYVYHYGQMEGTTMYDIVVTTFQDPVYSGLYTASALFLGFHLYHGFQSAFQSLGFNHEKYTPFIVILGRIYAIIIAVGFASFPIYFYLMGGK